MKLSKKLYTGFIAAATAVLLFLTFSSVDAKAASTTMSLGSSGTQVAELQKNLKTLGYYSYYNITGYYGSITRDSVIRFQRNNSLYADGIAGPYTLNKINIALQYYSTSTYTVKPGDSLWFISLRYGMTVDRLKVLNNLSSDTIFIGQVIKVSGIPQDTVSVPASLTESQNPDLYWLSRIVEAESSGESYTGKVAVGSVIMNRVASPDFPDTVKGVIFDYFQGIPQFSPVANGTIYNIPSYDSIKAAQEALNGAKPVGDATYFFNPDKSAGTWIVNNKTYVTRIGNHVFYR